MAADTMDVRMARLEGSYEQIDRRLGVIEADIRDLRSDIRQSFYWLLSLVTLAILVPIALRFIPS